MTQVRWDLLKFSDEQLGKVLQAFLDSVQAAATEVDVGYIAELIERGSIKEALEAANLRPEFFEPLGRVVQEVGEQAGISFMSSIPRPPRALAVRFQARDLRFERLMKNQSSQLITEILDTTRREAQTRLALAAAKGQNPMTTALDLVGRLDRTKGVRTGGIIGLRQDQIALSEKVYDVLTDPARIKSYFVGKNPRWVSTDRRFDRMIAKAIREGKALDPATANKIRMAHRSKLLRIRGEMIARTETLRASNVAKYQGLQQLVDADRVSASEIRMVWDATEDRRTRPTHRALDGVSTKMGQPFTTTTNVALKHPCDPLAPPAETINCRCTVRIDIDFASAYRRKNLAA